MRDSLSKCRDLGLEISTGGRHSFKNGNKDGKLTGTKRRFVFGVLITRERAETNPGLTGLRGEGATHGVSKRLREIGLDCVVGVSDNLDRNDGHAG